MPEYLWAEERNREMAEVLGLTVETVSRIMAELRCHGISNAPRGCIVVFARAGG
jgi:CRP-like cAMP-binding protein